MPEYVWIAIVIVGSCVIAVVLWIAVKRGLKGKVGAFAFTINGKPVASNSHLEGVVRYVIKRTGEIRGVLYGRFLREMKNLGADAGQLNDYEDSKFMRQALKNFTSGGNGTRSVQKIIEDEVISRNWGQSPNIGYICTQVWPTVLESLKDYLNSEYDSETLEDTGRKRRRRVSNTRAVEIFQEESVRDDICRIIESMLLYAGHCLNGGCKDGGED